MNNLIKKQITQEIEQYKLEIKNEKLQGQLIQAQTTINNQNQHIQELYSAMNFGLVFLALVVTVFGIAIPLWNAFNSRKMFNELKEIKNDVDGFISIKLKEWENQNIDDAVEDYIKDEISWMGLHTLLKWKPMSLMHMTKIIDNATSAGNISPNEFKEKISPLAYYLFEENKENKSNDFEKAKQLIINNKYLYTIALSQSNETYINIIKSLPAEIKSQKINDLLDKSDNADLSIVVKTLQAGEFLIPAIETIIADKIHKLQDRRALSFSENNKNIIDLLEEKQSFNKTTIWKPRGLHMQLCWGNGMFQIKESSYLSKKLQKNKNFEN